MEFITDSNFYYALPVAICIILILVYVIGFGKAQTPAFDQLSHSSHLLTDDRKPAGKRRKLKEKRSTSNGHATFANNDKEDSKSKKQSNDKSPNKTTNKKKQEPSPVKKDNKKVEEQKKVKKPENVKKENKQESQKKENKQEIQKKENKQENQKKETKQENQKKETKQEQNNKKTKKPQDRVEEIKNKKNERNLAKLRGKEDKPIDFDEGEWEQAYSRKDKKKKKEEPTKITASIQLFLTEEKEKEICVEKQVIKEEVKQRISVIKEEVKQPISDKSAKVNSQNNKSKKSKSAKKNVVPDEQVPAENAPIEANLPAKKLPQDSSETSPKDIEKPSLKTNIEISEPKVEKIPTNVEIEPSPKPDVSKAPIIEKETTTSSGVAFDELGEMWKEAAPTRKTKKKTRKE